MTWLTDSFTRPLSRRSFLVGSLAMLALGSCVPATGVRVSAIQFNHNTASATNDALNIRRNVSQTISAPEWTLGMSQAAQSPAAYSIQSLGRNAPTILVRLQAYQADGAPYSGKAEIRAEGGGLLGAIAARNVDFVNGVSAPEYMEITLANHKIGQDGVFGVRREDIAWQWSYRFAGASTWTQANTTNHRIYVVYREPRGPWRQMPYPDTQNPWAEALDFACSVSSGTWESDPLDGLAAGMAELINAGGANANAARLKYDLSVTNTHYSSATPGTTFDLTAFLNRWRGGEGNGELVNCTDCACIMTTFANLVGCDLWEGQIFTGTINPVMPIGYGQWWLPTIGLIPPADVNKKFDGQSLFYHEVAWKGDVAQNSKIYDVCYLVNGRADPANPQQPHPTQRQIFAPYGYPFADPAAFDYREKLAHPTASNVINTQPDPASKTRRSVR